MAAFVTTLFLVLNGGLLTARAAVLSNVITGVTTAPGTIKFGGYVRTDITFCVPNGSKAGDTFTLTYPKQYTTLPKRFAVVDQTSGKPVADVDIDTASRVITFTLNGYVESHDDVCGSAYFESQVKSKGSETLPLTFTAQGGKTFTSSVTVGPKGTVPPNRGPKKVGSFPNPDQCRTDTSDCLTWRLQSPVGPLTAGTITDPAGDNWTWDCKTVEVQVGTPTDEFPGVTDLTTYPDATVACSKSSLKVAFSVVPAGKVLQVTADTDAETPGVGGGVTYPNTAAFSSTADGKTTPASITTSLRSARVGGKAAGRQSVTVGDYVWYDSNHNGIQNSDEKGIKGVTLTLTGPDNRPVTDVNGKLVKPTKTDENGKYLFSNLPVLSAGQHYTVSVTKPAGYVPTLAHVGSNRAVDSSTGSAESRSLTTNRAEDLTLDFGFYRAASTPPVQPTPTPSPGKRVPAPTPAPSSSSAPASPTQAPRYPATTTPAPLTSIDTGTATGGPSWPVIGLGSVLVLGGLTGLLVMVRRRRSLN